LRNGADKSSMRSVLELLELLGLREHWHAQRVATAAQWLYLQVEDHSTQLQRRCRTLSLAVSDALHSSCQASCKTCIALSEVIRQLPD
jgi:hypothetical protein